MFPGKTYLWKDEIQPVLQTPGLKWISGARKVSHHSPPHRSLLFLHVESTACRMLAGCPGTTCSWSLVISQEKEEKKINLFLWPLLLFQQNHLCVKLGLLCWWPVAPCRWIRELGTLLKAPVVFLASPRVLEVLFGAWDIYCRVMERFRLERTLKLV